MGKIKYVQMIQGNYADSIDLLNQAVVAYPMFLPALIEKARAHMAVGDWDQAVDTAKRCLAMDDVCILALRIQAIFILARTGNSQEVGARGRPLTLGRREAQLCPTPPPPPLFP